MDKKRRTFEIKRSVEIIMKKGRSFLLREALMEYLTR